MRGSLFMEQFVAEKVEIKMIFVISMAIPCIFAFGYE